MAFFYFSTRKIKKKYFYILYVVQARFGLYKHTHKYTYIPDEIFESDIFYFCFLNFRLCECTNRFVEKNLHFEEKQHTEIIKYHILLSKKLKIYQFIDKEQDKKVLKNN